MPKTSQQKIKPGDVFSITSKSGKVVEVVAEIVFELHDEIFAVHSALYPYQKAYNATHVATGRAASLVAPTAAEAEAWTRETMRRSGADYLKRCIAAAEQGLEAPSGTSVR